MTIALPTDPPAPSDAVPRYLYQGTEQEPPFGGVITQIEWPGSRFGIDVVLPPLTAEQGRVWVARLIAGKGAGSVSFKFPQPGFTPTGNAEAAIDVAVSGGTSIALKGLAGGQTIEEGQFLAIIVDGRRYLHVKSGAGAAVADGSGEASFTIEPPLRVPVSVDDVVEVISPRIEGMLIGNERDWKIGVVRTYGVSFAIKEIE